ncbi:MAG TPA: chemotaxis protein CheW [Candidatus Wallbacteria bacterium]|nr:chemotaxis protein CheW [Candidatus Wallbacteria bacterium]
MPETRQYCTFYINKIFFGVEVTKIQEIIKYHEMTSVPLANNVISGLINLRGQIVIAIDLRKRLGLPEFETQKPRMNVVISRNDGALSLLVDEIGDVAELSEEEFETPPENMKGLAHQLICGAYKLKDRLLLILDIEKVLDIEAA